MTQIPPQSIQIAVTVNIEIGELPISCQADRYAMICIRNLSLLNPIQCRIRESGQYVTKHLLRVCEEHLMQCIITHQNRPLSNQALR